MNNTSGIQGKAVSGGPMPSTKAEEIAFGETLRATGRGNGKADALNAHAAAMAEVVSIPIAPQQPSTGLSTALADLRSFVTSPRGMTGIGMFATVYFGGQTHAKPYHLGGDLYADIPAGALAGEIQREFVDGAAPLGVEVRLAPGPDGQQWLQFDQAALVRAYGGPLPDGLQRNLALAEAPISRMLVNPPSDLLDGTVITPIPDQNDELHKPGIPPLPAQDALGPMTEVYPDGSDLSRQFDRPSGTPLPSEEEKRLLGGELPGYSPSPEELRGPNILRSSSNPQPTLTNNEAGKIIGWGTGQDAVDVAQTERVTRNLTKEQVSLMKDQGLTREKAEDLLTQYKKALDFGGAKLKNAQLNPRKELMERILELW